MQGTFLRTPWLTIALASVTLAACGGGSSGGTAATASNGVATSALQPIVRPPSSTVSTTTPVATTPATPAPVTIVTPTPVATPAPVTTVTPTATPTPTPSPAATAAVLTFSAVDYSIVQSTKTATVLVNRSGASSSAISVQYATVDGSGVAGSLYTRTAGTLQWAANDTTAKSISVPVSNTAPFTGMKSFTVALSNPSADASLSNPSSATVTVAGDAAPASLQFSAATYSVVQSAGTLSVTVARSGGTTTAASVSYATTDGSAVAGANYTSTAGTLHWAANDSSNKTFTVAISNAATPKNLTFSVSLTAPGGGAVLGAMSTATVTITPPVQASGGPARILAYLNGLNQGTGHRVLSGQHASIWNTPLTSATAAMDVVTPLAGETGQNPAILGLVLNYATDSYAFTVDVTNTLANQWWAKGGLVMLSLYDNDPTFSFNSTGAPTGQSIPSNAFHQLTIKGSAAYTQWHSQLDTYAAALHTLTDSGNTVLFRPFIELNGNWNWYGGENPADFIAVWQDMYDYMMVTKGLKNVLWIYNVNQNVGNYTAAYPGANYVDIVGLDIYGSSSQFVQYGSAGNAYSDLVALGKPLILPEVGLGFSAPSNNTVDDTTIINDIRSSFPDFVAFVVFNGGWAICNQNNASALMNDPWVVNLSGLPSGL